MPFSSALVGSGECGGGVGGGWFLIPGLSSDQALRNLHNRLAKIAFNRQLVPAQTSMWHLGGSPSWMELSGP